MEQNGYTEIVNLNDITTRSFFDLRTKRGDDIVVFQVTTRTHCEGYAWHKKYADLLRLKYRVIYINPAMTKYVISDRQELSMADIIEGEY